MQVRLELVFIQYISGLQVERSLVGLQRKRQGFLLRGGLLCEAFEFLRCSSVTDSLDVLNEDVVFDLSFAGVLPDQLLAVFLQEDVLLFGLADGAVF